MKDNKTAKNQNRKLDDQTPPPAVPNRAHTEMSTANVKDVNNHSKTSNSIKKQSTK